MTTFNSTKRIQYWDLAKGFLILMVVIFHISRYYKFELPLATFCSSFRMPFYYLLSGCVFKEYNGLLDFSKRKINNLLIPFVFFYIVCSYAIPYIANFLGIEIYKIPFSQFFTILFTKVAYPSSPIWFLLSLFEVNFFFYLIILLSHKYTHRGLFVCLFSLLVGCLGITFGIYQVPLPLCLDSSLSFLPFFAFGYLASNYTTLLVSSKYDKYHYIFVPIALLLVFFFAQEVNFRKNLFPGNSWLTLYPCGILGSYAIMMISKRLSKLPIVTYYGRYSIMVLVTHEAVFSIVGFVISHFKLSITVLFLVNLFLTLIVCLALIPLMRRYLPYVTAQKRIF